MCDTLAQWLSQYPNYIRKSICVQTEKRAQRDSPIHPTALVHAFLFFPFRLTHPFVLFLSSILILVPSFIYFFFFYLDTQRQLSRLILFILFFFFGGYIGSRLKFISGDLFCAKSMNGILWVYCSRNDLYKMIDDDD